MAVSNYVNKNFLKNISANGYQGWSESALEPDILNYWERGQFDIQLRHIIAIQKARSIQMKQVTSSLRAQPPGIK
jgi:hypothetical protein